MLPTTSPSLSRQDGPTRLVRHFQQTPQDKQSAGWSQLWDSDNSDLWDRGRPSPPLVNFVEQGCHDLVIRNGTRRPRAFVPGCGKGYDVAMLALHGFDVYGLEVSERGVSVAREYIESELAQPSPYNFQDGTRDRSCETGEVQIVHGDFFQRDWESGCAIDGQCQFDLIYDYTFLCALMPSSRRDWATRMKDLLAPTGILVCLEFPLFKGHDELGPPWPLQGVYWNLLAEGGDGVHLTTTDEKTLNAAGDREFSRVLYFRPEVSYENGRGTDMLSVWKRPRDS